jgi:hypothetical protein
MSVLEAVVVMAEKVLRARIERRHKRTRLQATRGAELLMLGLINKEYDLGFFELVNVRKELIYHNGKGYW